MDQHQDVEKWADSVLERHRSAPAGSASIEDEPFAEQLARSRRRHAGFAKAEAIASLIGAVLICAITYSILSTF